MPHSETSAFDPQFLETVKQWFAERSDIYVFVRYHAMAGAKGPFWFKTFTAFRAELDLFPPQTDVIVFRDNQFPLRGIVNDDLIAQALALIPENSEGMVANGLEPPDTMIYTSDTSTHADLIETLNELVGEPVSIGFYARWYEADNDTMISALIPLSDGTLKRGAY